ncbi:uncharacterized protein LOC127706991 [Mytilus californianus]|uniref:uncharacterized protein LOC127706991 n=1 Tax=Mytilus californianus TaxID=6549 RepID=UPI0022455DCD|nr:uncharacterized protein LOC127706991 [Mytilus californianus]
MPDLPVSENENTDPTGSADDTVEILIDMSTGKEIIINENEVTLCGNDSRPKERTSPPSKNRTGKTVECVADSTSRLLMIEEEKIKLKKRKIELMEESNELEKKKLKFLELISEKLSVIN